MAIKWGSDLHVWKRAVSIWDLVTTHFRMILNSIQSMRSLSVNFTGLFTKSSVLVGKVHRLSATISWEIRPHFLANCRCFLTCVIAFRILGVL